MIIDTHAHMTVRKAHAVLLEAGPVSGPMPYPLRPGHTIPPPRDDSPDDLARRLQIMDEAGVQMQVLSQPGGGHANEDIASRAARAHNDRYAELTREYPDRFAAYGQLPWPHVDACVAELRRAVTELGLVGAAIPASIQRERSPMDPEFEPVFEEANGLGCAIYFHPSGNGICSPFITKYQMNFSSGAPLEDTIMVEHLIVRQYPVKYSNIKFQVAHCGGAIPMILGRMDRLTPARLSEPPAEPPSATARRIYYDSVVHASKASLRNAIECYGADHIMAGSDFSIALHFDDYSHDFDFIQEMGLSKDEVEMILSGTAKKLFNLSI